MLLKERHGRSCRWASFQKGKNRRFSDSKRWLAIIVGFTFETALSEFDLLFLLQKFYHWCLNFLKSLTISQLIKMVHQLLEMTLAPKVSNYHSYCQAQPRRLLKPAHQLCFLKT